ncbi:MAG: T9SS type A sorting domain-containing protein [Bacteroidetes bacterium]|nr:T9SS type A sorting domain-containing protein [Bacteroidota bacterium]
MVLRWVIGVILAVSCVDLSAQTFKTTGNWTVNTNWNPAAVPSGTGTNVSLNANPTIDGATNVTIGSVTDITGGNLVLTVTASGVLNIGSSALFSASTKKNLTFLSGGTLSITGSGIVEIWGDLNIGGSFQLNLGGSGQLIVHGNVVMANNGQLTVNGAGKFTIGGNLQAGTGTQIQQSGSGKIAVTGSLSLGSGSSIQESGGSTITAASCTCSGCQAQCTSAGLPVTLLFFKSQLNNGAVELKWATASELNFNYFDLQRSTDGKDFYSLGKISGHGTTNQRNDYQFTDNLPVIGKNYYRLTSVDFDNYQETFFIILQEYAAEKQFEISPNPSDGTSLTLNFNFDEPNGTLAIFDNVGYSVCSFEVNGTQTVNFANPLKSGIYLAKYTSPSFTKTIRLLVR